METASPFDLNPAIGAWRGRLAVSPAFAARDLDELEGHLRESIDRLVTTGLTVEEAFWVGARRLGDAESLTREFAAARPDRVWRERLLWLVGGMLVFHCLGQTAGVVLSALSFGVSLGISALELPSLGGKLLALTGPLSQIVTLAAAAWLWNRLARGGGRELRGVLAWVRGNPGRFAVGVMLAEVACYALVQLMFAQWVRLGAFGAPPDHVWMGWSGVVANVLNVAIWPIVLWRLLLVPVRD